MTFIITLISLIIERFFHWSHFRQWRWFDRYQQWITRFIGKLPAAVRLILTVIPLMAIAGVIDLFLSRIAYGIPDIFWGVLILLYCMGPRNLWVETYACLSEMNKEDPALAVLYARTAFNIEAPNHSEEFHRALTRAIFIEANSRMFGVIFWFVLLGPLGAVMYRAITLCKEQSDLGLTQIAAKVQSVLDWIPIRVFAFIFALVGHFTRVFSFWRQDVRKGVAANEKLLVECGEAALDLDGMRVPEDGSAEKAALGLLDRVLIVTLVLLAIMVLIAK